MDEPKARRPLADDPRFLDSLSDLDAGLPADSEPRPPRPAPDHPPPSLPPSITAPFDALTVDAPAPTAPPSGGRRPLLELFPSESAMRQERRPQPPAPAPRRAAPRHDRRSARRESGPTPGTPEAFYGLREKPFAQAADPRFFYHSRPHDAVSQRLLTAIRQREGLVVLTGEIGLGKTTLARVVVEELDRRTLTSLVVEPFVSGEALLTQILCDFGVLSREELADRPPAGRGELSAALQSFVESLAPLQASAVVIVDEAQNLPPDVLKEVRVLCEAADASSQLQVVLVGQPSLAALLRRPENKALLQRVAVRCTLEPLPADEIAAYIQHRLAAASDVVGVEFEEEAIERVYELSGGVPSVVNRICERALACGRDASAGIITAPIVDAAAEDLDLHRRGSGMSETGQRIAVATALILFGLIGAAGAAWLFRDALARAIAQWK